MINYPNTYPTVYPNAYVNSNPGILTQQSSPIQKPETPSILQYIADSSGCGLYRMGWPHLLLNFTNKARVFNSSIMIGDQSYYAPITAVRIQRQAKTEQKNFIKYLCQLREKFGFKLQYEIDDIVFGEDIPEYNVNRSAFLNPQIRQNIEDIMNWCDEITVTCKFMRDYYKSKLTNQNITVVPNFQPRLWFDRFYDQVKINRDYDKNKQQPRILYCGSAGHYDIKNTGAKDDTSHIIETISKTVNDYKWIFLGAYPKQLEYYVKTGKIEHHPFVNLMDYPKKLYDLNIQAAIAPLANNNFNKAKSNIKWTEMCALGIPCICQDLCTYESAWWKFNTGDELIDQLKDVVGRAGHYKNLGIKLYKEAQKNWLDNEENIGCYTDLFKYNYNSTERKYLNKWQ